MATTTEDMNAKLLRELRRHEPTKVRVYAGDEHRDVAVPTRRKKWTTVISAINARSWSTCELLNKNGEVLAYVENMSPATDVEELDGRKAGVRSEAEWAVQLAVKTGRDMLAFRSEEHRELLKAQGEVLREMSNAMKGLASLYGEQRDAAADVATMRAEADNRGFDIKGLLEAAPVLIQMAQMARASQSNGKREKE
jgi:hypothetical protein